MSVLLETSEHFAGSHYELHLAPEGMALTQHGVVPADPQMQAVSYQEVAGVSWEPRGRKLSIAIGGERPMWVIGGLKPAEAAWAQSLISAAAQRARLYQDESFRGALTDDELEKALGSLAELDPPQAGVIADLLLTQAVLRRATDLHLQPGSAAATVRLRIDGSLRAVASFPAAVAQRVVGRLKVLGGMQTFQHAVAQTGAAVMSVAGRQVDLRFTVLPTVHGEKLTVRLFDPGQALLDLDALGMAPAVAAAFRERLDQPQGTLLLTGPAGSGKTTTMYTALAYLRERESDRSLATVEEPVELDLAGVDQTEVNRPVGLDFAEGLRSVLRQDPQVIMVGEIRDAETAHIAVQAGLTGHLVLSTVHAPSAAGVFTRLAQIGVEPYLVASSVTAVLSQRLVRMVCAECGAFAAPSEEDLAGAGLTSADVAGDLRGGAGCARCEGTGYFGRTGLFALLPVSREMREAVLACRPLPELEDLAGRESVGGLWEDGLAKVRAGQTTVAELRRVLGRRDLA
ncbi:MAG TPA: GspE/PulE family protein [Armatimonadota bacterium]|jgi:type II secretory ATPase GspE/PulE/Tfp pilus assembly ATPase PilB-like protein